jgi:hypothetical protein
MRLRNKHVADSVIERILAAREAIETEATEVNHPELDTEVLDSNPAAIQAQAETFNDIELQDVNQDEVQAEFDAQEQNLPGLDESQLDVGTLLSGGNAIDAMFK